MPLHTCTRGQHGVGWWGMSLQIEATSIALERIAAGGDLAKRALRSQGGFVQAMKLTYTDIGFGLDLGLEPGVADTGDLDADLMYSPSHGDTGFTVPLFDAFMRRVLPQMKALQTSSAACTRAAA